MDALINKLNTPKGARGVTATQLRELLAQRDDNPDAYRGLNALVHHRAHMRSSFTAQLNRLLNGVKTLSAAKTTLETALTDEVAARGPFAGCSAVDIGFAVWYEEIAVHPRLTIHQVAVLQHHLHTVWMKTAPQERAKLPIGWSFEQIHRAGTVRAKGWARSSLDWERTIEQLAVLDDLEELRPSQEQVRTGASPLAEEERIGMAGPSAARKGAAAARMKPATKTAPAPPERGSRMTALAAYRKARGMKPLPIAAREVDLWWKKMADEEAPLPVEPNLGLGLGKAIAAATGGKAEAFCGDLGSNTDK